MIPKFFNYHQEGRTDNGYETLQDFFLSWTVRCSQKEVKQSNQLLYEYSRKIVYAMIYGNNQNDQYDIDNNCPDSFEVISVTTKRQIGKIDLLAEISVQLNGEEKEFVLSIENKWYSNLSDHQLGNYRSYVEANYKQESVKLFITCDDCRDHYEKEKEICRNEGYKYLKIDDLARLSGVKNGDKTNNALFDEYWFNF